MGSGSSSDSQAGRQAGRQAVQAGSGRQAGGIDDFGKVVVGLC